MPTGSRQRDTQLASAAALLAAATLLIAATLPAAEPAQRASPAGAAPSGPSEPLAGAPPATAATAAVGAMLGFADAHAAEQRALEARFDAALERQNMRQWLQRLSARPHHVGSPYQKENADFLAGLFRSWGYEVRIEEFRVLFPTPKERLLEMVSPQRFTASLAEPAIAEDATSGQAAEQLPTYNAYSIDGDVTGDLVYVNFGVPKDYEDLERRGIDVKGKIVIARYFGSWRGIKPKVAAEHGAIGCIIYSDPHEDGYFAGDVYPRGGYRNERAVQRGSVADMPLYPGDPLTPGVGATPEAKRLDIKDARTLTRIPVLPISYGDALPLLRALGGPMAPAAWRGALPIPYHLGPGPARVHLRVASDWKLVPAYDVIARLPGAERPDEWVIQGNHYDGWVNGATDPLSSEVAMLEEARSIGLLVKGGWRPKRTIVFASWDGEEPGLLGSTEWAETHDRELRDKAVIYLNCDSNERGFLAAGGSHTLERLVNQVAAEVIDPEKKISVAQRLRASLLVDGSVEERKEARQGGDLRIAALGSGSDFTPFLQHLGIASLDLGYGGEGEYGQYHSIYDSFDHYVRFMDPTFQYGVALAETAGRVVLRMAAADLLPFEFSRFADTVGRYVKEVEELADHQREETDERNQAIDDKSFEAVGDPTQTWVTPKRWPPTPHLNFAPLDNARDRLTRSAKAYQQALERAGNGAAALPAGGRRELDAVLMKSERALLGPGLPRRPWYAHQVYAPGFYTGYAVKTLPGVREAIEARNWQEVDAQVAATAKALEAFAAEVDRATAILQSAAPGEPRTEPRKDAAAGAAPGGR
ncbi:MAG TPA: transferrin receptor-like dimerization domain-containing protein [Thermoanaerobaculia bacterium]|nr:transferrin receptor-like dimerization domain-containing protein [Thermoanaerobaculia bacterium]